MLIVFLLIPNIVQMEGWVQIIENIIISTSTLMWIWLLWKRVKTTIPTTPYKHESLSVNMSVRHKLLKQM